MSTREHLGDFTDGVTSPTRRLFDVTKQLISLYREVASLQAAEREQKIRTYFDSNETSSTARDRQADFTTLNLSSEILRLKGEVSAYQEERDFLRMLIEAKVLNGENDDSADNEPA